MLSEGDSLKSGCSDALPVRPIGYVRFLLRAVGPSLFSTGPWKAIVRDTNSDVTYFLIFSSRSSSFFNPGTDINALKESLDVDALRPSELIPNTYIFTLPEAVLPSAPMTSSTEDSSSPDDSSEDTTSDDTPTDELADTTIDPSDVIDDGVHSPVIEADSTVESATEDSLSD